MEREEEEPPSPKKAKGKAKTAAKANPKAASKAAPAAKGIAKGTGQQFLSCSLGLQGSKRCKVVTMRTKCRKNVQGRLEQTGP